VQGSLREGSPGVWQVGVPIGRDPTTQRSRGKGLTVAGVARRVARARWPARSPSSMSSRARGTP